jgi:TonB family protein
MLNKLIVFVFVALFSMTLVAQPKMLAVLPPKVSDKNISSSFQSHLRDLLEKTVSSVSFYKMIDRIRIDRIMRLNQNEIHLDKSPIELGELLNVDFVVASHLQLLKNKKISINCSLNMIKVGEAIKTIEVITENDDTAFKTACETLIKKLNIEPVYNYEMVKILQKPPEPPYPPLARTARIKGTVVVEITVGSDGLPYKLKAIEGPTLLYTFAIDYCKKWKFKPAILNEQPVEAKFTVKHIYK